MSATDDAAAAPPPADETPVDAAPADETPRKDADAPSPAAADVPAADEKTPEKQIATTSTDVVATGEEDEEPVSPSAGEGKILSHVERVYRSSETRTPIIVAMSDGDPHHTVTQLARREGCAVWSIVMGSEKNEQNALDYVEVGTQNGDWVYLMNVEQASHDVLRQIALSLFTLKPEPKQFPRRHLFRLFLVTDTPIQINDIIRPILPQSMTQNALVARAHIPSGVRPEGASPEKIQRRVPVDAPLHNVVMQKHAQRREVGRDSDSESDADEPEKKATGLWFHRAVDFYDTDGGSTVARVNEVIFDAIEKQDAQTITEIANSGRLNIDTAKRDGMNPLMFAVSRGRTDSVKTLLDAGADVHVRRESDNCPLLFMCIEDEDLFAALVAAGANIDERFEGYRLESHPTTMPNIAALVCDVKNIPKPRTEALKLAAEITSSASSPTA